MTTDPQATLSRAAAIIRERGWVQGDFEDESGRVCVVGAIFEAEPYNDLAYVATRLLGDRIGALPVFWNDAPGRTVEEVLAALEPRP